VSTTITIVGDQVAIGFQVVIQFVERACELATFGAFWTVASIRGSVCQCRGARDLQIEHPCAGYRTVHVYLRRKGRWIGERRIRRVMKRFCLHAEIKRAFVCTTDSNHPHRVYPNLLEGRTLSGINQAWGADFTYIRIANGFVYLAVILDLFSRRVVGWAISKHIDAELALSALRQAIQTRQPPAGCVHHSDRGLC
jgi:putative transposase